MDSKDTNGFVFSYWEIGRIKHSLVLTVVSCSYEQKEFAGKTATLVFFPF